MDINVSYKGYGLAWHEHTFWTRSGGLIFL